MDNLNKIKNVFVSVLGPDGIVGFGPDATMDDIENWDSLNFLNIIMELENEFGIRIDGLDAAEMTSVQRILKHVDQEGT